MVFSLKMRASGWMIPLFLLPFLSPIDASAIPEASYESVYQKKVAPYYESAGSEGGFIGVGGIPISYRKFEVQDEKGALVVLNGRNESYAKYAEVFYDLSSWGYSVYSFDHRGQGASGRMTPDPQMGYVDSYSDYVADLDFFMTHVVNARSHSKVFLLAHSMGGAIASLYASEYPKAFDAVVLSAPMFEINTIISDSLAYMIASSNVALGNGMAYAIAQGPYNPNAKFEDNTVTSSLARWKMARSVVREHPELALGGASYRWVKETLDALAGVADFARRVQVPVLLFQSGRDQVVRLRGQNVFCEKAKDCRKIEFQRSQHEILMEQDEIRDRALAEARQFFASH